MKLLIAILLFASISFAQEKPIDKKADKDSTSTSQIDLSKYELFDSAKDIDTRLQGVSDLRQKRLNELAQSDVLYNRYDAIYSTLQGMKKEYEDKKILQPKKITEKKKN